MSQSDDVFADLRPALLESLQEASPNVIREALEAEGIDADAAEDFLSSIGNVASAIGGAVAPRLPGILQGAMQGAGTGMAAGPYGALIGALGGAVSGGLSAPSGGKPAAAAARAASAPGTTAALLGGGGGGAAGSLLGLLSQPQVMQGLMAMLMGNAGAKTVPVAGQQVPPAAIANMVAHYANQAAAEWEERFGVPETGLSGLSESADEAERAEALATAVAIEGFVHGIGIEAADYADAAFEGDEEAAWDEDFVESTYGAPDYEPVYAR